MHPVTVALVLNVVGTLTQSMGSINGRVLDTQRQPVADATVQLEAFGQRVDEVRTTTNGRFQLTRPAQAGLRLIVTAAGFVQSIQPISGEPRLLEITLELAPVFEQVTVTSTRTEVPLADRTATMTVFPSLELLTSAALSVDDALKTVPGFTLFRRNSSRVSNPTAQAIILRGLGGSGQSRSLVLADGVPLNDGFGGWVYWDKIPEVAIDRIEVQRGSGSDLYGADALGGVVQILTLRPNRPTARGVLEGGGLGTGQVSLFGGGRTRRVSYSAAGEWFKTDGFVPISEHQDPGIAPRGPIDTNLGSRHRSVLANIDWQGVNGWRLEFRGSVFDEHRTNATPLSVNDTQAKQGTVEMDGGVGGGLLSTRMFQGTQGYDQTFTTVNATRTAEALNRVQHVPTDTFGVAVQWIRPWSRQALLVGIEGRSIKGSSIETPYSQGRPQTTTDAGGRQRVGSAFLQSTFLLSEHLTVVAGAHGDGWQSESAGTGFPKTRGSFNPRVALAYRIGSSDVSVRGSLYHGFRAPTLNELYRQFSVGSTETLPNQALDPESLTGGDGGIFLSRQRVSARVTGFWNVLDGAITTVTLQNTPTLIVKQRANADRMRARGVEFEGDLRLPHSVSVNIASAILDSVYEGGTGMLNGRRVSNVPGYSLGVTTRYADRTWTGSVQFRVTGPAADDDLNLLILRRAAVFDVYGGRAISRHFRAFVAVENLLNEEYDAARTPVLTIGLPRTARIGVQMSLP
jgi:outer membrane receptor protein involved in Fe transport